MRPKIVKLTIIETTPDQLRRLADALERMWGKARFGEDVPKIVEHGDGCQVHFVVDQEEMSRQEWLKKKQANRMGQVSG